MTGIIYARYSSDNQREESIEGQLRECKAIASQNIDNTTLPLLKKKYAETIRSIDNLLDAIQKGILTASTKDRLESFEKDKSELSVQIIKEEIARPTLSIEGIIDYFNGLRNLTPTMLNTAAV